MSPSLPGRFRSRRIQLLLLAVLALLAGATAAFLSLGRFMAPTHTLQPADAIFVFAGTRVERPLEAADLYAEGYAPRIVVTRATAEQATFELKRRGVRVPADDELNRDVLLRVGVPESALVTPDFVHDNTAEEARTLRELALAHGWQRVILVSSKYHMRRVLLTTRRALRGTDVEVMARGSRYDPATPETWWTRRSDIRWLATEVPKLLAYAAGIGV